MSDTQQSRNGHERVVAVFPTEAVAAQAVDRAKALGAEDLAVDDPQDHIRALAGEMREETDNSWAGPSVGIYTPEMARRVPPYTAIASAVGALLFLPIGFLRFGDMPLIGRLAVVALCGAVAGGTIGFLVGGFIGARKRTNLALAEERGVVVGIRAGNTAATKALAELGSMRVDLTEGEVPVATIVSREAGTPAETAADRDIPEEDGP